MESTDSHKKTKFFWSKQQIEVLLHDWEKSGQSVKGFCANLGIGEGTFYNWKMKFSKDTAMSGKAGFAPIEIVSSSCSTLFAEVGSKGIVCAVRLLTPGNKRLIKLN